MSSQSSASKMSLMSCRRVCGVGRKGASRQFGTLGSGVCQRGRYSAPGLACHVTARPHVLPLPLLAVPPNACALLQRTISAMPREKSSRMVTRLQAHMKGKFFSPV